MPQSKNTFSKNDRLVRLTDIQELFQSSSSFYLHPFKVISASGSGGVRVMISVPKKLYPKAVDRNRIRRQIKEAYRLNKLQSQDGARLNINIAYIYLAKEPLDFKTIENKLIQCNSRLLRQGKESSKKGETS